MTCCTSPFTRHNTEFSAAAFLLALRAKGYHPQVVVTDLRQDYGPVIARSSPRPCITCASSTPSRTSRTTSRKSTGPDYAAQHPEAERLKQAIYAIFNAETLALATERYAAVARPAPGVRPDPARSGQDLRFSRPPLAQAGQRHRLPHHPTTNNAVEMVIRRFDQHYQNFCGFESLADAQRYLAVFEKLYRFTPFSQDAQPRIRGQSPLQLAGYDVASLPMTTLGGLSLWPINPRSQPKVTLTKKRPDPHRRPCYK